jgi:hypothetical protein
MAGARRIDGGPADCGTVAPITTELWIPTLVIVATPGTGALYTMAGGLARGGRAGPLAAFVCTLGIVPHMLAAITGQAALLHTSAVAHGELFTDVPTVGFSTYGEEYLRNINQTAPMLLFP